MTCHPEEAQPIAQKDAAADNDDSAAMVMVDASKPSKAVMKTWGVLARITLALYLCGSVVVYMAFSKDEINGCFLFCDRQSLSASNHGLLPQSYSQSSSRDAPEPVARSHILPSFKNGGVIFFLHVPKTGGISVRKAMQEGKGEYLLADDRRRFDRFKRDVGSYVKYGTDGELVTLELHASSSPTIMEVSERLRQWRKIASKNNVPFFAFTVLREPLSYSTSWFNFFHGMDHGDENFEYFEHPTEQDFLDVAVFNPQCGFLARGDRVYTEKREQQMIRRSDCDDAYSTMLEHMDWIGTTATLSNETFPILRSLVASNTNADHMISVAVKNKSKPKIKVDDLSPKAVAKIRKMTIWDEVLYERVQREYRFDKVVTVEEQTAL